MLLLHTISSAMAAPPAALADSIAASRVAARAVLCMIRTADPDSTPDPTVYRGPRPRASAFTRADSVLSLARHVDYDRWSVDRVYGLSACTLARAGLRTISSVVGAGEG